MRKLKRLLIVLSIFGLIYARETYDGRARDLQTRLAGDMAGIEDHPADSAKDMQAVFQELDNLNTVSPFLLESSPWAAFYGHRLMNLEKRRIEAFSQVDQIVDDAQIAHNNDPTIDIAPFVANHRTKMHEYTEIVSQVTYAMGGHVPAAIYDALLELDR